MLGMTRRPEAEEHSLLGRAPALAALEDAWRRVEEGTSARLVITGPPGSGRTALLDHLAERAAAHGHGGAIVLRADGVASESALAYAGLFDLCAPVLDRVAGLPEPSATVLAGALGHGASGAWGSMAVGGALLALLTRLAAERPVLVRVDDADDLDADTLDAVLFAGRRLGAHPVAVVLAGGPSVAARVGDAAPEHVELAPLDRDDAVLVLERACPVAPDAAVRDALLDVAQGNPLALSLLPRSLSLPQLKGRWPLPDPLPTPSRLGEVVAAELGDLDDDEQLALTVVAASLTGARPAVAAALDALGLGGGRRLLDDLVAAGHLVADGGRVRFARPLVRSVAYARASSVDRRRAHTALSQVIGGELSIEQRAWHVSAAAVGPDQAAATLLEDAATLARSRGASASAAAMLDRAVALSALRSNRARRRLAAAETLIAIGENDRARVHLECAEADSADAELLVAVRHLRGRLLVAEGQGAEGQSMLAAGGRSAAVGDPHRAVLMLCEAAVAALHGRRLADAEALVGEAEAVAVDPADVALARLVRGAVLVADGRTKEGRALLRAHRAGLDLSEAAGPAAVVFDGVAVALVWGERYREATRLLDLVIDARRRVTALGLLPSALGLRALLRYRTGRPILAYADAVEALRIVDDESGRAQRLSALAVLCSVEATLGFRDACLDHVGQLLALLGDRGPTSTLRTGARSAAGSVELGAGRPAAALAWLEPLERALEETARGNPGVVMWEADLIEALVGCDRLQEARARLDGFEGRAQDAGNQRALGAAARCRGLLAWAAGDQAGADAAFARSLAHYRAPQHPGAGRTLFVWGERLAAARRHDEAIERLRAALEELEEAANGLWAKRAAALLADLGAPPPPGRRALVDLRPEVAQVALLTAAGFDADKVADHLLLARPTVLRHLAEATDALGERPSPTWLRPVPEPGDASEDGDPVATVTVSSATVTAGAGAGAVVAPTGAPAGRRVTVLGRFRVTDAGTGTGATDRTPPDGLGARLVKVLAVAPPAGVAVDEVVELLWPELEPAKGRARLRNVLNRLRTTSGDLVVRAGESVRLAPTVDVDLRRFDALAREAHAAAAAGGDAAGPARAALALHAGDLLPDSPYDGWAAAPRERLRRRVVELHELLATHERELGRLDAAVRHLERAIALDVYDEERYVLAAELRREQGRHGAAMALLQRARAVVQELGLAPSPRLLQVERSMQHPRSATD
jgi:DNA-binding SARP family transcriptional activator